MAVSSSWTPGGPSWGVALPPSHISSSAPGPARPIHLVRPVLPESSEWNAFLTALAQERRWFFGSDRGNCLPCPGLPGLYMYSVQYEQAQRETVPSAPLRLQHWEVLPHEGLPASLQCTALWALRRQGCVPPGTREH